MKDDRKLLRKSGQAVRTGTHEPPVMNYVQTVGNQAAIQRMLTSNFNPYGKDFLVGSAAENALDEEIAKEDPDWHLMISGLEWRPAYASGQVMKVWNKFKIGTRGGKEVAKCIGSLTGEVEWIPGTSRIGVWDMGHIKGSEYWRLISRFKDGKVTLSEVKEEYQNWENYQVEDPSYNRSHKGEAK